MRKEQAVHMIRSGRVKEWNAFRKRNPDWMPDLSHVDLSAVSFVTNDAAQKAEKLSGHAITLIKANIGSYTYDFSKANFSGTKLPNAQNNYMTTIRSWEDKSMRDVTYNLCNFSEAVYDFSTSFPAWFDPVARDMILVPDGGGHQGEQPPVAVFVSYAWADDVVVQAIDHWLLLKGLQTKIDKRDFFAGSRLMDEILRLMQECDVILVFYSEKSKDKPWAEFERDAATDLQMEAKKAGRKPPRVIYVVMDDTPLPSPVQSNRLAVTARGKTVRAVAEELYLHILQTSRGTPPIDPTIWDKVI